MTPPPALTKEEREAVETVWSAMRFNTGSIAVRGFNILLSRSAALDAAEAETTQTVAAMDELQNDYMAADTKIKELLTERDALAERVMRLVNGVEMLLGAEDEIQRAEAEAVLREAGNKAVADALRGRPVANDLAMALAKPRRRGEGVTLTEKSVGAASPSGEPLTAPSQEPRPGNSAPETERDTPGAPLGDTPATGDPRANRGGVLADSPLTIACRLRLEPGAAETAALNDLWARYCRVVVHDYRRVKHYTDLYPSLPKKEKHLGDCAACGQAGVLIVCVGSGGPLCATCHAPYTETGLWTTLYPQAKEKTVTRISRKKETRGQRITRHYPARRPLAADNPVLVARLSGTLHGEAFQAAVALIRARRAQAALFERRSLSAEKRAEEAEARIVASPPCDYYRGIPRRKRVPRCKCERHLEIRKKRKAAKEADRWRHAWQGCLGTPRDLSGIALRARGPRFAAGGVVHLNAVARGWSSRYSVPAVHRTKPAAWFSRRIALATEQAEGRVVYVSIFKREGVFWLGVPLRFAEPEKPAKGWLGVWPTGRHVALAAATEPLGPLAAARCEPWGLAGSDLRRARAGWKRHQQRAAKRQIEIRDGKKEPWKRYRLARKWRTTHTHVRATVATDTHRLAKRIVERAVAGGWGLALPAKESRSGVLSAPAFAGLNPLPVNMLLNRIAYKARIAGVPLKAVGFVALHCPRCGGEWGAAKSALHAACRCGLSLDRGLARASLTASIASGWAAPPRAGPLEGPPAHDSPSGSGPGEK